MPAPGFQNSFSGNPLDRASERRDDEAWLAVQRERPEALALVLWKGQPLLEPGPEGPRLQWLSAARAFDLGSDTEVFLGLWRQTPVFAVEMAGGPDPAAGPLAGLGQFADLRASASVLTAADLAMAGTARSLIDWHRRHGYCSACGQPSQSVSGGWKRRCPACGTEHFPRTDPVVIMLPVKGDRCLLGRQAAWPAGRMSALAGFVEPGESLEEACARELAEEAGLTATAIAYHSSQPWPFPSQLMVGLIAEVAEDVARPDQTELEAVRWLTRDQARATLSDPGGHDGVLAPPSFAIAHSLMQAWVDGFGPV